MNAVSQARKLLGELPELLASLPRLSDAEAAALAEDLDTARSGGSSIPPEHADDGAD